MNRKPLAALFALLASIAGSACAMKAESASQVQCSVERGDLLPAATGGAEGLCDEIRNAVASAGGAPASVVVRVISAHALEARISIAGRELPPLNMARSDRELSRASLARFARSIAAAAQH